MVCREVVSDEDGPGADNGGLVRSRGGRGVWSVWYGPDREDCWLDRWSATSSTYGCGTLNSHSHKIKDKIKKKKKKEKKRSHERSLKSVCS